MRNRPWGIMERVVSSERSRRGESNDVSFITIRWLGAEKIAFASWKMGLFSYFPPFCFASCGWTDDQMKMGIVPFERAYQGVVFVKVSWESVQRVRHKSATKVVYFHEFMILKVTSSKLDIYWETQSCKSVACLAGWLTGEQLGSSDIWFFMKRTAP